MTGSLTMLIEIIKPFTKPSGIVVQPHPIYSITRVGRELGERLIAEGVAIDMHKDGVCMLTERRKRAQELGIEYKEQI